MKVTFEVLESPDPKERGETLPVDLPEHSSITIGREYDVRLPLRGGDYISRHHLVMEVVEARCFIRDMSSTNGTFVRHRDAPETAWEESPPKQATPIHDGDCIRLGKMPASRTTLRVHFKLPRPETRVEEEVEAEVYCTKCGAPAPQDATTGEGAYICPKCRAQQAIHPNEERLPTITPDYETLKELGRGGMGVVYQARRVTPGNPKVPQGTLVALKTIIAKRALTQKDRYRFKRESQVCKALFHPHLVRFFEHCNFKADERFWFVMEYVEGVDAAHGLPFSLEETFLIADQILEALDYAHQAPVPGVKDGEIVIEEGATHRDIKPSNILITGRGTPALHAKLTDFGLAKAFQFAGQSHFTATNTKGGAPYYMSPEHVTDFRMAGPLSDIYSLGATLYTLLTGKLPYEVNPHDDIFLVTLEEPVIPPDQPFPYPKIRPIIEKATEKEPADRYQSAAEIRTALAGISRPVGRK